MKFKNYENVHQDISIGGRKRSVSNDRIMNIINKYKLRPLLDKLPEKFIDKCVEIFFSNKDRKFSQKPDISDEYKNVIINLSMIDIIELEKITNKDFSKWKTISK